MSHPGLALQPPGLALPTARAGDSDAPHGALGAPGCPWVPWVQRGTWHHPPTPPGVSMKGNSEERAININELICTERLSLIPQPDSAQKEG